MTDTRERPPPTTAPAAAIAATQPGCVVGLDGIRGLAALFAAVFELPFQRHRGWVPLRQAMSARLRQLRPAGPARRRRALAER